MQIGKAGIVAVGALATVAVVGAPAAAAQTPQAGAGHTAATVLGIGRALAKQPPAHPGAGQPLITIGTGSKVSAAAWQICGSTATAGVGGTAASNSPHTVVGDCTNSNAMLKQHSDRGVISILDDSAVRALPWQVCGSNVVGGLGLTAATNSPAMVAGDCHNSNTLIQAPDGPTGDDSLISLLSGSVVDVLPWQVCGSSAVMGAGAVVAHNSPTAVLGDCTNGGIMIEPAPDQATLPLLSNAPLSVLPLQACETDSLASLVGVVLSSGSPAYVGGACYVPQGLPE